LAKEDATMATALEALEHLSQDPEAQRLAREREDAVLLYKMSLNRSRRQGIAEGRAEGRAEAMRATIRELLAALGIEPTSEQVALLNEPAELDRILTTLIRERRWP
jgi:hypothetical protein